ncbi:uncharacterized protein K452DRAFT_294892 [Aplosporella prunicola CBS 121167]|uniref:SET domain-containing protein n=1 Tax=Aplosporella prunicola CBS 121167 TaxID=1176127 RepID=A0A6A6BRC0_9PEZI|nr:uncharacterized protein K452DRAFT_294892 [Aplosporella prunicola CBS 121167]KAF2146318.1 hypothetical protein K452DRAFT_294892 [Aplosporella prunicola CBS 121167]
MATATKRASSPQSDSSTLSCINVAASSSAASPAASTPPTSHDDDAQSDKSEAQKPVAMQHEPEPLRRVSSRARASIPTYNDKELAGTRIHTPTKYTDGTYIRKTGKGPVELINKPPVPSASTRRPAHKRLSALSSEWTTEPERAADTNANDEQQHNHNDDNEDNEDDDDDSERIPRRQSRRVTGAPTLTRSLSERAPRNAIRGRETAQMIRRAREAIMGKKGALRSGGTLVRSKSEGPAAKRRRLTDSAPPTPEPPRDTELKKLLYRGTRKPWLNAGKFYNTGQDDVLESKITVPKSKSKTTEGDGASRRNEILPLPMFTMAEKLDLHPKKKVSEAKRPFEPFQLPFDVFCPLPREARVKWKELRKNEYKGEDAQEQKNRAREASKKAKAMEASVCTCTERCDRDACFNSSLFFECDDRSCKVGPHCGNRQFAELRKRHKDDSHGKYYKAYNVGVEIIETKDRGNGVRAMRTFEKDQIVVEYVGEIITQQESDRRMREEYKDHKCFYLMNFYDKLIIDGFRGNIARFVNHSCEPNCRMEKWYVNGEQRMALFANRPVMTGEELTWHYNFESYGQDQPCYCGSANCAGVIGRQVKNKVNNTAGTKRKSSDDAEDRPANKKQRLNNLAATASSKTRNVLAKAKEGLKDLIGSKPTSVAEKKGRDERAARRSLASTGSRKTRSSGKFSPPERSATTVLKRLREQSRNSGSPGKGRSAPRKQLTYAEQLVKVTAEALDLATDESEEDDSEDEHEQEQDEIEEPSASSTPATAAQSSKKRAERTPASPKSSSKQTPSSTSSSNRAGRQNSSAVAKTTTTPASVTKSLNLKQSTLSFLPLGLGLNKNKAAAATTVAMQKVVETATGADKKGRLSSAAAAAAKSRA